MEAFGVAVALWPADLGGAVFNAFELEERLVWVLFRSAAALGIIVGGSPALIGEAIIDPDQQRQVGDKITL